MTSRLNNSPWCSGTPISLDPRPKDPRPKDPRPKDPRPKDPRPKELIGYRTNTVRYAKRNYRCMEMN